MMNVHWDFRLRRRGKMLCLGLIMLGCTVIAAYRAKATDCTLSDSAIMSLDYNLQDYYLPAITASVMSKQDVLGTGVQFNIQFPSTNTMDNFLFQVSDENHGAGTLAGINVSAYSNFDLKFTLVSIDGSSSGNGLLETGALVGPYGSSGWGFHPVITSLTGSDPSFAVSVMPITSSTLNDIGFYVSLLAWWGADGGWSAGPHDVTLLVSPADGAVQIPEPATWVLVLLGVFALTGGRRLIGRSS